MRSATMSLDQIKADLKKFAEFDSFDFNEIN